MHKALGGSLSGHETQQVFCQMYRHGIAVAGDMFYLEQHQSILE
jgi:hypothetical protein